MKGSERILSLALFSGAVLRVAAQTVTLSPEVVTATRLAGGSDRGATSVITIDTEAVRDTPAITLDGALRSVPSFSLFRRSDSLTANPTAQGVSLRGLGPSGASRSLVLLNGVPLNDPFGGWVAWTKVPRESLDHVEVVPGGGATAWGNSALGGVVQLFSGKLQTSFPTSPGPNSPYLDAPDWVTRGSGRAVVTAGDFGTRSAEFAVTQPVGRGAVQLLGRDFTTDGFSLVAPERRGPIDIAAWSRHRWLGLGARAPLGDQLELGVHARYYEEFRGNGTPYQRNGSREKFVSASLAGAPAKDFSWQTVAYAQEQSFASTFSSVNTTRTAETPASDQFAVPATAAGASWTGTWQQDKNAHTVAGVDARVVRGETQENFSFSAGSFTRQRIAGGDQANVGIFVLHERSFGEGWTVTLGARLDRWTNTDGHRRETDRATGAVLRDDVYASDGGGEFSPNLGLAWSPTKTWRVHGNLQRSYRQPTLNELYRPFRQGANVTEANPALQNEHAFSGEIGVEWTPLGRGWPTGNDLHGWPSRGTPPPLALGVTAFANDFRDAVGNVTLARGPGTFPLFGTLATGGVGRQRLNLDRLLVQGLEFSARWHPQRTLSVETALLISDATVRRTALAPALVGKQLAQVPRYSASVGVTWRTRGDFDLTPRVRWIGRQFEDDENTLRLGEVLVADLGARHALGKKAEVFIQAENLGDARIETGRSADGVVNVGTPRFLSGGLRYAW